MYKNLDHISNILWHFVGRRPEAEALQFLEMKITEDHQIRLAPFTKNEKFHKRFITLTTTGFGPRRDLPDKLTVLEPRAVCFCDIPVHNLPSHMNKYGNVGIGIRKSVVLERQLLKPVLYFPLRDPEELRRNRDGFWTFISDENVTTLDNFLKAPTRFGEERRTEESNTETFKEIYEEREWRGFDEANVSIEDIAFFVLPNRNSIAERETLKNFIANNFVGLIFADDIFESSEPQ